MSSMSCLKSGEPLSVHASESGEEAGGFYRASRLRYIPGHPTQMPNDGHSKMTGTDHLLRADALDAPTHMQFCLEEQKAVR